jgi:hypothetical protein
MTKLIHGLQSVFFKKNIINVMLVCHYGQSFERLPGRVAACFALKTNGENQTRCPAHDGATVLRFRVAGRCVGVSGGPQFASGT